MKVRFFVCGRGPFKLRFAQIKFYFYSHLSLIGSNGPIFGNSLTTNRSLTPVFRRHLIRLSSIIIPLLSMTSTKFSLEVVHKLHHGIRGDGVEDFAIAILKPNRDDGEVGC